jgi:aldose 1-epimerase
MALICHDTLYDIPGYHLEAAGFYAFICAKMGANCIQFSTNRSSFLRTPKSFSGLMQSPNLYGMPILFPPNRIKDGIFTFQDTEYRFPINEPERGHHIHGLLSSTEFVPLDRWFTDEQAFISFSYEATKERPYLAFPHSFKLTITYLLNASGLTQQLILHNTSETCMPFGLGLHTTFNNTFIPGTKARDYRLKIPVSREIHFDRTTIIPTGEASNTQLGTELNVGSICPHQTKLSNLFSSRKTDTRYAIYKHIPTAEAFSYYVWEPFDYWMLFNTSKAKEFFCLEPQSWIIDAPNSMLPPSCTGFRTLAPGTITPLVSSLQPITSHP